MVWSAVTVLLNHLGKFLRIIFEVFLIDLVDIASPLTRKLSLFNLYVALSRNSGRETICLLRDFNDQLFTQAHDLMLLAEDDRLEDLNKQTIRWWKEMRSSTEMDLSIATQ
jgi:hypothetical protein